MSFIGPVIPSHLRADQEAQDSDSSDSSDDNFGPKLPSVPCRGPAPAPPPENDPSNDDNDDNFGPKLPSVPCRGTAPPPANDPSDDDSDDDFGPALPPHLQNKNTADSSKQEESDDEFVGPKMSEITTSMNRDSVEHDVEMRAKRMRDKLEGKDKVEPQRESWMLELPEEKANRFGLGPRQFSRKGRDFYGDNETSPGTEFMFQIKDDR